MVTFIVFRKYYFRCGAIDLRSCSMGVKSKVQSEPVLSGASLVALVQVSIAVAVSFGVDLSGEQAAKLMALTGVIVGLAAATFARGKVSPVNTTDRDSAQETS